MISNDPAAFISVYVWHTRHGQIFSIAPQQVNLPERFSAICHRIVD
jgi:hypothetical protein